jgi:hypothetical protein
MVNKINRDKRILEVLKLTIDNGGMTCEEIFKELCVRSKKNGVKSIKALSKILQRFPLIKSKKIVVSSQRIGVEICCYVTMYKLEKDYETKVSKDLLG